MENRVRRGLSWLFRLEVFMACTSLMLVVAALLADVVAREIGGDGIFGAQRFAVFANSVGGLLGFAIVVHTGGHLRVGVVDKLIPEKWESLVIRFCDLISAALCILLGYLAVIFVRSTYDLGDTEPVFDIKIWPIQVVLPYLFGASALRYLCYAAFPAIRPEDKEIEQ